MSFTALVGAGAGAGAGAGDVVVDGSAVLFSPAAPPTGGSFVVAVAVAVAVAVRLVVVVGCCCFCFSCRTLRDCSMRLDMRRCSCRSRHARRVVGALSQAARPASGKV